MRSVLILAMVVTFSATQVLATSEKTPDIREISKLQARAALAGPQDQCFLYAELIHSSTDLAVAQMRAGEEEQASPTIESVESYAMRLYLSRAKPTKKLKSAEILLEQSAFRLKQLLMGVRFDDRPSLERALRQVSASQAALLLKVFER